MTPLDKTTKNHLREAVLEAMRNGSMFTSLDITNQAKHLGYRVRNRQVSEWLRKKVIPIAHEHGCLYNQSLITVDSKATGITLAYVYHPYAESTDDYLDRDQNPKSFNYQPDTNTPPAIVSRVASFDTLYFGSRETARDFARQSNDVYKFKDQQSISFSPDAGKRWSCIKD